MKKKTIILLPQTSYQIYQAHRKEITYPYLLTQFLLESQSQFENNRAVRLLVDWLNQYKKMSQVYKHKYTAMIPKVLKKMVTLFSTEEDIYVCLAPFYYQFYLTWPEFSQIVKENLNKNSPYALKFMWYICFDFCEQIDPQKQYQFNKFISQYFQKSLFQFQNPDEMLFKPLLQTIRMINIQCAKKQFVSNSKNWIVKMKNMLQSCSVIDIRIQILIQIIGCHAFLLQDQQAHQFWLSSVNDYFTQLQNRIPKCLLKNKTDLKLLDSLQHISSFHAVRKYILSNKKRFIITLLSFMKENTNFQSPFYHQKYYKLRRQLVEVLFFQKKQQSFKQMDDVLTQFNRKYISVLKDSEYNLHFFDSMCQSKIQVSKTNLVDIIKSLSNSHTRKMYPVNIIIILVRVLYASSQTILDQQNVFSIIKSLSQCITNKINDPLIFQLRLQISKYYLILAKKYNWSQLKTTQIMLYWCEQFERNSQLSTIYTINLIKILTKKYSNHVFTIFGHKLQAFIRDIIYKLHVNRAFQNIPKLVSLIICLYIQINWKQSYKFITQLCSSNPQDLTFLYLLQSQIVTCYSQQDKQIFNVEQFILQFKAMIQTKQFWVKQSHLNVFLYYIELVFDLLPSQKAKQVLFEVDLSLLNLFKILYEKSCYHSIIHFAVRSFSQIGCLSILKKLKSYEYFKSISFDILSKSFNKISIILMTYMYCSLIIKSKNFEECFLQLNKDKFLDSLFQGCNDFIGKSSRFYQQVCYIVLFFMKAKEYSAVFYSSILINCKQIQKNRKWWQQAKYLVSFRLPHNQNIQRSFFIIEFKEFYENHVREYFQKQITRLKQKDIKAPIKQHQSQQQGDQF